jgi:dienelactone hydrolase
VILAVDFGSTARSEADFRQFAQLVKPSREIWQSVQPDTAERELLSAETYLRWWRELPEGVDGQVDTVMGYCVGGVFASVLADEIAEKQGTRPALLLFDPEPVDQLSLYRDFKKAVDGMSLLSEEERAGHAAEVRTLCEAESNDAHAVCTRVIKVYETAVGVVFDRLGLDDEASEDLRGLFRSYVSYLFAARQLSPEEGWAAAGALTSAQSSPGAAHARWEKSFPISTGELLSNQEVAEAAHRFLQERGA